MNQSIKPNPASHEPIMNDKNNVDMTNLLEINSLSYHEPKPLSVVRQRASQRFLAQQGSYSPGSTAVIYFNTGDSFVNTKTSYLIIPITFKNNGATTTTGTPNFKTGDITYILDEVSFYGSDGSLLHRIRRAALKQRLAKFWKNSMDQLSTSWGNKGYQKTTSTHASYASENLTPAVVAVADGNVSGDTESFILPLDVLHEAFNVNYLMPSFEMSNSRIEIRLAPNAHIPYIVTAGAPVMSYSVGQILIQADCLQLSDQAFETLQEISEVEGLSAPFVASEHFVQTVTNGNTNVQLSLKKPLSLAVSAVACFNVTTNQTTGTADTWVPCGGLIIKSWRWRLGTYYYPNLPCDSLQQHYQENLQFFNEQGIVRYAGDQYSFGGTDVAGEGLIPCILERSSALAYSGQPLSAARSLDLEVILDNPPADIELNAYVSFIKIVTNYLYDKKHTRE